MERAHRRTIKSEQALAFEHATDDGLREILVVQDLGPAFQRCVRREDHWSQLTVTLVDGGTEPGSSPSNPAAKRQMTEETISMKLTWYGHSAFRIEAGGGGR